uniref:Transcription factor TFIIE subunit alpha n=1 Tax=uncultured marine thaumarchaeote AD1000_21_H05 TaxID=1455901 RepID=A0A075FM27_9ARCH|nr:transcription factor TFIIE subunit alpha [uncultured marine thaumarchaeote AD1000_21_H05]
MTFEDALEEFFKCPSCGGVLNLKKNEKVQKAFVKQIDKIRKEMQS